MTCCAANSTRSSSDPGRAPAILVATLAAAIVTASSAAAAGRVVVLPIENLSAVAETPARIAGLVERELAARGWTPVVGAEVEDILRAARIRRLDSLSAEDRRETLAAAGADRYLALSVLAARSTGMRHAALAARLVDAEGGELFAEVAAVSADDLLGALDRLPTASFERVVDEAVARLFARFPAVGEPPVRPPFPRSPRRLEPPRAVAAGLATAATARRVVVLPFVQLSDDPSAARIVAWSTARWLERTAGLDPVAPADLRAALVAEGIRNLSELDSERLAVVCRRLDAGLALRGRILEWRPEPPAGAGVAPPVVEIHLQLIDVGTSRIVWAGHHRRRGDDYRGLLGLGGIGSVAALQDRVLGEMLSELDTREGTRG